MATVNQPSKRSTPKNAVASGPQANVPLTQQLATYFKGVRTEWTKISWPTWPQVWGQTIVVLVMTSLMTFILFIMDYSFHSLITFMVPHQR